MHPCSAPLGVRAAPLAAPLFSFVFTDVIGVSPLDSARSASGSFSSAASSLDGGQRGPPRRRSPTLQPGEEAAVPSRYPGGDRGAGGAAAERSRARFGRPGAVELSLRGMGWLLVALPLQLALILVSGCFRRRTGLLPRPPSSWHGAISGSTSPIVRWRWCRRQCSWAGTRSPAWCGSIAPPSLVARSPARAPAWWRALALLVLGWLPFRRLRGRRREL